MKKVILTVAMLLTGLQPAFAQNLSPSLDTGVDVVTPQVDLGTDVPTNDMETTKISGEDIAIGIIGGIVGGIIAAEIYDRRYPEHRPGGRVACFARNNWGDTFRAVGRRAHRTQELAMEKCFDYSRRCRPLGCQPYRHYGYGY